MDSFDDVDREPVALAARLNDRQLQIVAAAYELVVATLERVSASYGGVAVGWRPIAARHLRDEVAPVPRRVTAPGTGP